MNLSNNLNQDNSIDLLTSILLEYPAINTVDINLEEKLLKITFLIYGQVTDDSLLKKIKKLEQNFRLFNKFNKKDKQNLIISKNIYKELTKLTLIRKLTESSEGELDFIIKVVKDLFKEDLLGNEYIYSPTTNGVIDSLLEKILQEKERGESNLEYLGFIEEDKILVFNKNKRN